MNLNQRLILAVSVSWLVNSVVVAVPPVNGDRNYRSNASDEAAASSSIMAALFDTEAILTASDAALNDKFGYSVSISGDTAIVGALFKDGSFPGSGAAYIYELNQGGHESWGEVVMLTASDAAQNDTFGESVSIDDDVAIIGASRKDVVGSDSGAAYIFYRNSGGINNWGEVIKLSASDASTNYYFGVSVSISGDTAIVGAYTTVNESAGAAYIFQRDVGGPDNWGQVAILTAMDGASGDSFGFTVSISGDTAIVGAAGDDGVDDDETRSGSANIFQRDLGGNDNWGEVTKLTAVDPASDHSNHEFGSSVSISGDTAIVGAIGANGEESRSGAAYIFQRDVGGPDNWGHLTQIWGDGGDPLDDFGSSVSINGDAAIVGATGVDGAGAAYIFKRNLGGNPNWVETNKFTASDAPALHDGFGWSVSISGDAAISGKPGNRNPGLITGAAYIYYELFCGNGVIDLDEGEVCDDGNTIDCDGCRGDCSADETGCGDGFLCGTEDCDDGNTNDCDGCLGDCTIVELSCGNGVLDSACGEICDDGNTNDCDGCRGDCSAFEGTCGDGELDSVCETCDDSNTDHCDGCTADCQIENCDDGVSCTIDSCDLALGCQNDVNGCVLSPAALTEEPGFSKDRYVSIDPTSNGPIPVAVRVTRVGSTTDRYLDCTSLTDLGDDGWISELIDGPLPAPDDAMYYCDLSSVTTGLHIRGCNVLPGNVYNISMTADGTTFSMPMSVPTTPPQFGAGRSFSDLVGGLIAGSWTAPDGLVTANDLVSVVQKFSLTQGAPILARLDNNGVVPNGIISGDDILRGVYGFAGNAFGYDVTNCLIGTCEPPSSCEP